MRLHSLSLCGVTRFNQPVEIDFASLPSGLVAIQGPNGAGKTTIMESIAAALFLELPSRTGALHNHCHGRDAYIQLVHESNGNLYRHLVKVDAEQGAQEAYLFNGQGNTPLTSGKVREYQATIAQRIADRSIFLASSFMAQNRAGNFLDAKPAERKEMFTNMLGLGELAAHHEAAKLRAKDQDLTIAETKGAVASYDERLANRARLEMEEADRQRDLDAQAPFIEDAQRRLTAATEQAAKYEALEDALPKLIQRRADILVQVQHQRAELDGPAKLRERLANNQKLMADKDAILAAEQEAASLQTEIDDAEKILAAVRADKEAERQKGDAYLAAKSAVTDAAAVSSRLQTKIQSETKRLERLELDAGLMRTVPCDGEYPSCQFLVNAARALDEIPAARIDLETLGGEMVKATEAEIAAQAALSAVAYNPAHANDMARQEANILEANEKRRRTLKGLETLTKLRPHLDQAEERAAELQDTIGKIEADILAKEAQVAELDREIAEAKTAQELKDKAIRDRNFAAFELEQAQKKRDQIQADLGGIRARLDELKEIASKRDLLAGSLDQLLQEKADWEQLAKAFGKDGIPALEIDAAGPEVSGLTNELLMSCFGPRFTVAFETTRPKADGSGTVETFDVRIIDNERGREGAIATLSGGEKVILNEAISLALAIFNSRKSGRHFETLFRDETAGALDPENAQRYVQMLRRALSLGGFHQVLFIAHQPEVWEAADAVIRVADGRAEVAA